MTASFSLSPVTKDEMPAVITMLLKAYNHSSAFVNAVYPHKLTDDDDGTIQGLDMVVSRLQYLIDIDPSIRWLKVTDSSTGEIVSASQWNVYDKDKPPEMMLDGPSGAWENDVEKKFAVEMFEAFITPRWERWREVEVPIICLNIMGTSKKYQHQGAATLQVKQFTSFADEMNALMTTESTCDARWLYEKNGFVVSKDAGHWVVEARSEEFAERPKEWLFFMERPRAR